MSSAGGGQATGASGVGGTMAAQTGTGGNSSAGQGGAGSTSITGQGGATSSVTSSSGQGAGGAFDPFKDPTPKINHPGNGEMRKINMDIPFIGSANDPQDGMLSGASLVWASDKEGKLGIGNTFTKQFKVLGKQVITLTATDSDGNKGTTSVTLEMIQ